MQVVMIGAPLTLGQTRDGVRLAPQALRDAGIEREVRGLGHDWADRGDLVLPRRADGGPDVDEPAVATQARHSSKVSTACSRIADEVEAAARQGPGTFVLTIGGDHAIAMGTITGIHRARSEMAVIWVDSHGDFNTPATTQSGNIHGMPMASLVGHRADLPEFAWMGGHGAQLAPAQVALVGIRSLDSGERQLLKESGIAVFTMKDIDRHGIGRIMERALEAVDPRNERPIHVSYDIDAVDPSEAPGTGTAVKGGLTYRESHLVAEFLAETGRLGSMDLVEINPELEQGGSRTVNLGLEIILSALGKNIL